MAIQRVTAWIEAFCFWSAGHVADWRERRWPHQAQSMPDLWPRILTAIEAQAKRYEPTLIEQAAATLAHYSDCPVLFQERHGSVIVAKGDRREIRA